MARLNSQETFISSVCSETIPCLIPRQSDVWSLCKCMEISRETAPNAASRSYLCARHLSSCSFTRHVRLCVCVWAHHVGMDSAWLPCRGTIRFLVSIKSHRYSGLHFALLGATSVQNTNTQKGVYVYNDELTALI
jgi:hypothetical protein